MEEDQGVWKKRLIKLEREILLNKVRSKPGKHNLTLVLDNLKRGFNIGKIFRSADVFSIHQVHVVGTKEFNPYPAKGALRRVPLKFFSTLNESISELKSSGHEIFVFDTHTDDYLDSAEISSKAAFVFGNEEFGPKLEGVDSSDYRKIKIRHFGVTESLNVSVAASIACYEFSRRSLQATQK